MTVKELRKTLSYYPDDTIVLVPGYESGFDHISHAQSSHVFEFGGLPYYEGRFQESIDFDPDIQYSLIDQHDAILLRR